MEDSFEEQYVFLRRCHSDFGLALTILGDAAALEKDDNVPKRMSGYLHQYAVVVYFRPFTRADTKFLHGQKNGSQRKKISLSTDYIPSELEAFHMELHSYRDSAYAHSDIAITNPRLNFWRGSPFEFPIGFSPVDKKPLHIHRSKIEALCKVGLEHVTKNIRDMEDRFRVLYPEE